MADTIAGKAVLLLSANGAQLVSGLSKAQSTIQGFGTRVAGIARTLFNPLSAAFAGALGGAAVTAGITSATDAMAKLARDARAFGLPTESYSALAHAAGVAGIESDDLRGALLGLNDAAAEASRGNADFLAVFEGLGVAAGDLRGANLEQVFYRVADGVGRVQNPLERMRLAMRLFGEEDAARMLPFLQRGSAGLRELTDQARRAGIAFDDFEASQILEADAASRRLWATWGGLWRRLTVELAPAITDFARLASESLTRLRPLVSGLGQFARGAADVASLAVRDLGAWVSGLVPRWEAVNGVTRQWGVDLTDLRGTAVNVFHGIARAGAWMIDQLKIGFVSLSDNVIRPVLDEMALFAGRLARSPGLLRFFGLDADAQRSLLELSGTLRSASNTLRNLDFDLLGEGLDAEQRRVDDWFARVRRDIAAPAAGPTLTPAVDATAARRALDDLARPREVRFAAAAERGSREAAEAVLRFRFGGAAENALPNLARQQLDVQRQQLNALGRIAENVTAMVLPRTSGAPADAGQAVSDYTTAAGGLFAGLFRGARLDAQLAASNARLAAPPAVPVQVAPAPPPAPRRDDALAGLAALLRDSVAELRGIRRAVSETPSVEVV